MPDPLTDTLQGILRLATTLPEEPSAFAGLPPSLRARAAKQLAHIFARLKTGHDISETLSELAAIAKLVSTESGDYDAFSPQKRKKLSNDLEATLARLESAVKALSPIKYPQDAFDPFAPKVIGHLIADKLLEKPRVALEEAHRSKFYGAGVYALYYGGPFDSYAPITGLEHPIYVGKSDPADLHAVNPKQQGHGIWQRLHDHHGNLSNVESLDIDHFDCRFLVVHSAWVTPAEDYLIEHFRPVWNKQMKNVPRRAFVAPSG